MAMRSKGKCVMDGTLQDSALAESDLSADNPAIEEASREYLGRWNRLISSTNWEKGRIISQWREALIEAGAAAQSYTDEAWSRRAGNVTPQHTGRLRRVHQRFSSARETYAGLYWSHFQAALDWEEAEMWLEGAVQNCWSIAQMQGERSRTLGAVVEEQVEASAVGMDEDADDVPVDLPPEAAASSANDSATDSWTEADVATDAEADGEISSHDMSEVAGSFDDGAPAFRPFENLPDLPADLREAFDNFKLAIVHHRIAKWQEVSQADVLTTLDSLWQLVLAPADA
jgi:hypothetical protein